MFMHMIVLVNSITFFMSLALITILTHELPLKPWVPITILSAFGAFMCVVTANSPQDFMAVLSMGSFILLAALVKCLALHKVVLRLLEWARIRVKL
uniref:Uncharacterized protein n=1 Tax=Rhizophora mucronata TaxID=61149 RepID=A0A2P2IR24_RHIMU